MMVNILGKYTVPEIEDVKDIPDYISIVQTDYQDTTIRIYNPSRNIIDSIYSDYNLMILRSNSFA